MVFVKEFFVFFRDFEHGLHKEFQVFLYGIIEFFMFDFRFRILYKILIFLALFRFFSKKKLKIQPPKMALLSPYFKDLASNDTFLDFMIFQMGF